MAREPHKLDIGGCNSHSRNHLLSGSLTKALTCYQEDAGNPARTAIILLILPHKLVER
jgi:hypothetical protein